MSLETSPIRPVEQLPLAKPERLACLDAYRGFVMLLMASGGFGLAQVARHFPGSSVWEFLAYQTEHAPWIGCSLWDLIQPSFMFLAGVSMPFSYASRKARGDSRLRIAAHVLWRSLALILLGIFLRSEGQRLTYFTFEDVLTQIGLGYALVYLLVGAGSRLQLLSAGGVLVAYWLAFYHHPLPAPGFDYHAVGLPKELQPLTGLAARWNINANLAADFDRWFLNLFPRNKPFEFNYGGYQTLNFIPSMATMIFGLMAGEFLRRPGEPNRKAARLALLGALGLLAGLALDHHMWTAWAQRSGGNPDAWTLCPIIKRIWTPTWVIFSTGWTLLLLAGFYYVIQVRGWRRWSFPLVVIGMNSIAMYVMAELLPPWIRATLRRHVGQHIFDGTYGPMLASVSLLAILWVVLLWMYRRRVFLRI